MICTLCGFMGAGKSTIGRKFSLKEGFKFIDLDDYIELKFGRTIPVLFNEIKESGFREEEYKALLEIIQEYNYLNSKERYTLILSLGGGTLTNSKCADIIKNNTYCIYLQCSKDVLVNRLIKNNINRPLLANKGRGDIEQTIENLMREREPIYKECSKVIVDTDSNNVSLILSKIEEIIISI